MTIRFTDLTLDVRIHIASFAANSALASVSKGCRKIFYESFPEYLEEYNKHPFLKKYIDQAKVIHPGPDTPVDVLVREVYQSVVRDAKDINSIFEFRKKRQGNDVRINPSLNPTQLAYTAEMTWAEHLNVMFGVLPPLPAIRDLRICLTGNSIQRARDIKNWMENNTEVLRGVTSLELDNYGFTILPDQIGLLTGLQRLSLDNNKLSVLPLSMGTLSRLQTLILKSNRLIALPFTFGQLTGLQQLDLEENQLSVLPLEFGQLASLEELSLANNKLLVLPSTFSQLTQLQELRLYKNQLTVLTGLENLGNLRVLDLSKNKLTDFSLLKQATFTDLQELHLGKNKLTTLPAEIGRFAQLTDLSLDGNELSTLPDTLTTLPNLDRLHLSGNPFTSLPKNMKVLLERATEFDIEEELYQKIKGEK